MIFENFCFQYSILVSCFFGCVGFDVLKNQNSFLAVIILQKDYLVQKKINRLWGLSFNTFRRSKIFKVIFVYLYCKFVQNDCRSKLSSTQLDNGSMFHLPFTIISFYTIIYQELHTNEERNGMYSIFMCCIHSNVAYRHSIRVNSFEHTFLFIIDCIWIIDIKEVTPP